MFGTVYHYAGDGLGIGESIPSVARTGFGGHLGRMLSWRYCFQCHYLFGKGDLALSVGMTMTSTVLAPVLTPLITWMMAGTFVHVDALSMFFSIVQVVILPIVVGFVIQKYCPRFTSRAVGYLPAFSSVAITFIVGIIVSHSAEKLLTSGLLIILVVMLHNICGLLLGFSIGKLLKLEYKKCVAISIEVGMQNSGLASSLATLHFAAYPMATIPGAIFSVWHNISGALMARLYSSRGGK